MRSISKRAILVALMASAMLLMFCVTVFADDPPLVTSDSEPVEIDYAVNEDYPWVYDEALSDADHAAWKAGNSYIYEPNVSNIAITVTGEGRLTYDYKMSTPKLYDSYAYYYNMGSPISSNNYTNATNYGAVNDNNGEHEEWRTETIAITNADLDENNNATVYVAYFRSGYNNTKKGYVAISNVKFVGGDKTLTINGTGEGGSVSVAIGGDALTPEGNIYTIKAGSKNVTLTASPASGYRFYGWVDKGKLTFISSKETYTIESFGGDEFIEAVFAPDGTYTARCDDMFFTGSTGLKNALSEAEYGDTVVMFENHTISGDLTVPKDVTLIIPCMDDDDGYIGEGDERSGPDGQGTAFKTGYQGTVYRTLTIPSDSSLNINGTVLVNAVVGHKNATADQDISGGHGQIDLSGEISVNSGGMLENFGIVDGSGLVTAHSGGTIVDLYVVRHWRGGSHGVAMYTADNPVYPMNEIDCHNITSEIMIESGGSFVGAVKMFATYNNQGGYYKTHFPQIDNSNGLIRLNNDAYLVKTYNKVTSISTIDIYGGATFSESKLEILGKPLSTSTIPPFPLDGDIELNLNSGDYIVSESFKLLTGAKLHLASDATLTVNEDKTLVLYDEFEDLPNTGSTQYPDREPAVLTVDGGSTVSVNGIFAGRVATGDVTEAKAKFITAANAILNATTYEANGYQSTFFNPDATISRNFKAELWANNALDTDISESTGENTWTGDTSGWNKSIQYLRADINMDKIVNSKDLNIILRNYNQTGDDLRGDLNNDKIINSKDLNIILRDYNKSIE